MPMINWLTKDEIRENYNHKGFLLGIVPVYVSIDEENPDEAIIQERNGVPFVWLYAVVAAINTVTWLLNFGGLMPAFPSKYPIFLTGVIE